MKPFVLQRLLLALEGTPDVLDGLLEKVSSDDPVWDFRPNPDRFTLREIVAHLTDFEPIWLDRCLRTVAEGTAQFERVDPDQLAIKNDYANSEPAPNRQLFRRRRQRIVDLFKSMGDEDWSKQSVMPQPVGALTVEFQAMFLVVHDAYHTGQIAQWLQLGRRQA